MACCDATKIQPTTNDPAILNRHFFDKKVKMWNYLLAPDVSNH